MKSIDNELHRVVQVFRIPRVRKSLVVILSLSVIAGVLEFFFSGSATTPTYYTANLKEGYVRDVRLRIAEAERYIIAKRDEYAHDKQLLQAIQSKNKKQIIEEVYTKDSLIRYEASNKGAFLKHQYIAFAFYDSLSTIIGWNTGATYIKDVQTSFLPPYNVSNLVKGVYFEESPTKQYLTAFHKLFDENDRYIGTVVIKLFLCDEELTVTALHADSHDDVFSDYEKKNNLIVRLASKEQKDNINEQLITTTSITLVEGGPLSTIYVHISEPSDEMSADNDWNVLSALRDLFVFMLFSTVLFSLLYAVNSNRTVLTSRVFIQQILQIALYSIIIRYLLYIFDVGRSLLPHTLVLQTDFAYQSIPLLSDPLELLLSSYCLSVYFIGVFILLTSNEFSNIRFKRTPVFALSVLFILAVSVLLLLSGFLNWFVELVTMNCSFDVSGGLEMLLPNRYFIPLVSLFIVTFSVVILSIGVYISLHTILTVYTRSLPHIHRFLLGITAVSLLLLFLFSSVFFDVGFYTLLVSGVLSFVSTIPIHITPRGFKLTRSPIIALTLASMVCFMLAPSIKFTNQRKQQLNLEQSVLSKASFQFTTASIQLSESLTSPRSYFSGDTISNPEQIPFLLMREQERLQEEILGVTVTVSISSDTSIQSVSGQQYVGTVPFYIRGKYIDSSSALQPQKLTATLTNNLLSIGVEEHNAFALIYTNDKIESSTQTDLNFPTKLAGEIRNIAGKGSWIASNVDGKDVLLFVKSIYSISSNVPEKILVGGLVEYTFEDVLVFGLRYSTLTLTLTALVILLVLAATNKISLSRYTLGFRERIFLIIFSIALVPLIFVSNITRTIIESRDSENQQRELLRDANKTASIIQPLVQDTVSLRKLPRVLQDISRTLDHRIDVFDGRGILIAASTPRLYDAFVLPKFLSLDVLYKTIISEQTSSYSEYTNDYERISTSYHSIYDQPFSQLLAVLALTRVENISLRELEISATTSLIYGSFSLVALVLLILGSYVSYRVASPLQDMIIATEKVAKGEFDTQVYFNRKDEIGDLASAFNKMTRELESSRDKVAQSEREGAWKEMARQVAHEIKNPLTPMKLSVQHIQHAHEVKDTNFSAVFTRVMKTLSEQIDVLTRIATEFSRFGEMPRRRYGFVSLKKVVESALALFDSERAHIRFISDIPDNTSLIYADEEEFRRTLVNLLRNAVQAMDGWGVIVISSNESNGIIHLSIKDTGAGMSAETLQKAFDPNFSTKTSGMGLGLAIVKRTITDMSGTIRVESVIGKGTTFHIDLPAREG